MKAAVNIALVALSLFVCKPLQASEPDAPVVPQRAVYSASSEWEIVSPLIESMRNWTLAQAPISWKSSQVDPAGSFEILGKTYPYKLERIPHHELRVSPFVNTAGEVVLVVHKRRVENPESMVDPSAVTEGVNRLRQYNHWTEHATSEEIDLFSGPETEWVKVPKSAYDLQGFDPSVLGSSVPPAGVHPRILFNYEDLPAMRERLLSTAEGRDRYRETEAALTATMLNPLSDDGKVFSRLSMGKIDGLKFMDPYQGPNGNHRFVGYPKFGLHPAHVCYWPRNLHALAFYSLLKGDEGLCRLTATAVYHYYKLREPLIDRQNSRSNDPNAADAWPADLWRGMHWTAGESHLGFAYDLTARFMTDEQKDLMRRVITKATAGKRSYGGNGPVRWRDTNWAGWDTQHFLCHLAIERTPGFDWDVYKAGRNTVYGYLTYGINSNGNIFETNGKNGAGFHFALVSAIALARRGENMLGHPHLRRLSAAQVQQTVPDKSMNVNNGTYGCANFGGAGILKRLYPNDPAANWLLRTTHNRGQPVKKSGGGKRIHPLTANEYFNFAPYVVPDGVKEDEIWRREHLDLPLDAVDPIHGQLNTRSSNDKHAAFLMFEARPDLYCGGHQQHDAGHFYFSSGRKNWATESDHGLRDSRVHNIVLVDGIGQGHSQHLSPSRVKWTGSAISENAAFSSADITDGYAFNWSSPMHYSWTHSDWKEIAEWRPVIDSRIVKIFKGTQHWKCRIWDHSYWNRPWGPTMRGTYNPVKYAHRTAGLVRGKRPYGLIVDSIRKDDSVRSYTWQMQVAKDVQLSSLPNGVHFLRSDGTDQTLIVYSLGTAATDDRFTIEEGEILVGRKPVRYRRLSIRRNAVEGAFTVLLVPMEKGQPAPILVEKNGVVHLRLDGTEIADILTVRRAVDGRPSVSVERANGDLLQKLIEL